MTTELSGIRAKLHEIVFEADTPAGKAFDIALRGIMGSGLEI
jgi:hypothetical protein